MSGNRDDRNRGNLVKLAKFGKGELVAKRRLRPAVVLQDLEEALLGLVTMKEAVCMVARRPVMQGEDIIPGRQDSCRPIEPQLIEELAEPRPAAALANYRSVVHRVPDRAQQK